MILFLADVCVNENRKILLCKTIGGVQGALQGYRSCFLPSKMNIHVHG